MISDIYTNVITMNTEILSQLEHEAEHCRDMKRICREVIKQFTGKTPPDSELTLSVDGKKVVSIPIGDREGDFCLGTFMRWYDHYNKRFKEAVKAVGIAIAKNQEQGSEL